MTGIGIEQWLIDTGNVEPSEPLAGEGEEPAGTVECLADTGEIGRASCRERVCQYVKISVVAVSLQKKKHSKNKSVDSQDMKCTTILTTKNTTNKLIHTIIYYI